MFFKSIMTKKPIPQSYKPVVEAPEVIELFSRLTLHHQVALLRLMSRNLQVEIDGETTMGYDMDFEVVGAMIKGTESLD
jgi:hypothetical protein|tara:strand:+ start:273 stop:509 length:237 start_codon:yes stop_codon:yes gene_type:complete